MPCRVGNWVSKKKWVTIVRGNGLRLMRKSPPWNWSNTKGVPESYNQVTGHPSPSHCNCKKSIKKATKRENLEERGALKKRREGVTSKNAGDRIKAVNQEGDRGEEKVARPLKGERGVAAQRRWPWDKPSPGSVPRTQAL